MDETVVGVGTDKTLAEVIDLAQREIARRHGNPLQVNLRSAGLHIEACRSEVEAPLESVTFRISPKAAEDARNWATGSAANCSIADSDGWTELRITADSDDGRKEMDASLEALSAVLDMPSVWRIRGSQFRKDGISPVRLFETMTSLGASDVHLYPGSTPVFRVDNRMGRVAFFQLQSAELVGDDDFASESGSAGDPGDEYSIQPLADTVRTDLSAADVVEIDESILTIDEESDDPLPPSEQDNTDWSPDQNAALEAIIEEEEPSDATGKTEDPFGVLSPVQILDLVRSIAPADSWKLFEDVSQCSFRYQQLGLGCARVSAFIKTGVPHCTFRYLPESIPSFRDLRIPGEKMTRIGDLKYGLVLVTGMTGSGKSTSVAALIDWLNSNRALHILTIEEPIEYVHASRRSVVSQREIGVDVDSFRDGVHGALRHDPDVIFIGEMRDADTVRSAISAAATGHLVISTMHSNTTGDVVNQIVSFFDPSERDLVRLQLRDSLRCVMCQRLIPKPGGGRVATLEFLFNDTEQIAEAIHVGDSDALRVTMQQKVSQSSLFEQHLLEMVKDKLFELEYATQYAPNPLILEQMHLGTYAVPRLHG